MSESNGKLGKYLGLPVPSSKKVAVQLGGVKAKLNTKLMPGKVKGRLLGQIDNSIDVLGSKPKGKAKAEAKLTAFNLAAEVTLAIQYWDKLSSKDIARIEVAEALGTKTILTPVLPGLKKLGLNPDDVPYIKAFGLARHAASQGIGSMETTAKGPNTVAPTEAETTGAVKLVADTFVNAVDRIIKGLPGNFPDDAVGTATQAKQAGGYAGKIEEARVEATGLLDRLDTASGDRKASLPFHKRLNGLPKSPFTETTGESALQQANAIVHEVRLDINVLVNANALALAKRQLLLNDYGLRIKTLAPTGVLATLGMELSTPHGEEISRLTGLAQEHYDTAELCLKQKISASGLDVLDDALKDCKTYLEQAEAVTPKNAKTLDETRKQAVELGKRSKWIFFDSDLQKYAPKTASLLKTQTAKMENETARMSSDDKKTRYDQILAAAEEAEEEVAAMKLLCTGAAALALNQGRRTLGLLDTAVKPDPFYGPYAEALRDLEVALDFGAEGPDQSAIKAAMATLEAQSNALMPGGKLDTKAVSVSQVKGKISKGERDALKLQVETAKRDFGNALKTLKTAVEKAKPGDVNALGDLVRDQDEIDERTKTVLKGLDDKLGDRNIDGSIADLKKLAEDYARLQLRATTLQTEPGGRVGLSPKQLAEGHKIFEDSLSNTRTEVGDLALAANAFTTLQIADRKKVAALVAYTLKQLDQPAAGIKTAADALVKKSTPETMAERLKARETGLASVRRYRDICKANPVLIKLKADDAFANAAFNRLEFAIDNLDLNFNRGI